MSSLAVLLAVSAVFVTGVLAGYGFYHILNRPLDPYEPTPPPVLDWKKAEAEGEVADDFSERW